MLDKAESRRVRNEIRQVLLSVWDPIGVADVPECADEYDCCVGGICDLLTGSRSDDAIAEYLLKMSNEHMGLSFSKESTAPTIVALREIPSVMKIIPHRGHGGSQRKSAPLCA